MNILGPLLVVAALAALFAIDSIRAKYGVAAYYASKAALVNFTRQLAAEMKRYGIFVNALDPGGMDTARSAEGIVAEQASDELSGVQTNRDPTKRLRPPDAIVPLVLFLPSEASNMMTGRLPRAVHATTCGICNHDRRDQNYQHIVELDSSPIARAKAAGSLPSGKMQRTVTETRDISRSTTEPLRRKMRLRLCQPPAAAASANSRVYDSFVAAAMLHVDELAFVSDDRPTDL